MVEALILYCIFALTTSLAGYITLVKPVINRLRHEQPLSDIAQSPTIASFVFIVVGFLVAPAMFLPTIIPSYAKTFQESLFETISE